MFSLPLLKQTIKENSRIWFVFGAILTICSVAVIGLYHPEKGTRLASAATGVPFKWMTALGMSEHTDTLTGVLAVYLYGFLLLIGPLIYEIIVANRLMAKQVASGTMMYLLATPNPRRRIGNTQACFLSVSLLALFLYIAMFNLICCSLWFPGKLVVSQFVLLNLGIVCLHSCISGFCFLISCVCDETKTFLMLGAGIPVLFYLLQLLANLGGNFRFLKYATIFTLFSPGEIVTGSVHTYWHMLVLVLIGGSCYLAGLRMFGKRDLPF